MVSNGSCIDQQINWWFSTKSSETDLLSMETPAGLVLQIGEERNQVFLYLKKRNCIFNLRQTMHILYKNEFQIH